jgi:hypothetical protein
MIGKMFMEGTYLVVTESGKSIGVYISDEEIAIVMSTEDARCDQLATLVQKVFKHDYREMRARDFGFSKNCNALVRHYLEKIRKREIRRFDSKKRILAGRAGIKISVSHESARMWDAHLITPGGEYDEFQFYSHTDVWSIRATFSSMRKGDFDDVCLDRIRLPDMLKAAQVTREELRDGLQKIVPHIWEIVNLLIGNDKIVAFSMTPAAAECRARLGEEVDRHAALELKRTIEHRFENRCSRYMDMESIRGNGKRCYVKISDKRVIYAEYHKMINYFTQTFWPEGESLYEMMEEK